MPGDVCMDDVPGRGLIHNEIPAEGVTVHSLQLWINLPAADKMTAPRYQDLASDAVPVRRQPGVEVRVFSGASGGVTGRRRILCPSQWSKFNSIEAPRFRQNLPTDYNAVIIVLEGGWVIGTGASS